MNAQPAFSLDAPERDALAELASGGVGRAASSLRSLVGGAVLLAVRAAEMMTFKSAAERIGARENGALVGVHQSFHGEICGGALLILPESNSLELVRAITGGGLALDDVIALEQEALAETGNIILNGCLAAIATRLGRTLSISLPEIIHGCGSEMLSRAQVPGSDAAALFLTLDFSVGQREIDGYIAMLMDQPSLTALKALAGKRIECAGESTSNHATS